MIRYSNESRIKEKGLSIENNRLDGKDMDDADADDDDKESSSSWKIQKQPW